MAEMKKKYGLVTAVCMVVGIVVGSGIFFQTENIINKAGGNILIGFLALVLGAIAMIFGSMIFGEFARRYEKTNGIVDYTEVAFGNKLGYLVGWFKSIIYYPGLISVLSWVSARYTLLAFNYGGDVINSNATWILAFIYLVSFYVFNYFAPIISGKFQVGSTFIKLVPLITIGVVATIAGLANGVTLENYGQAIDFGVTSGTPIANLLRATVVTTFAYEGWLISASINKEIHDSKRTLPKALVMGTTAIMCIYLLYYLGVTSFITLDKIDGSEVKVISEMLFGKFGGAIIFFFIAISCVGTLNGLVLGSIRNPYSIAIRGQGIMPEKIVKLNKKFIKQKSQDFIDAIESLSKKIEKEDDEHKLEVLSRKVKYIFDKIKGLRKEGLKKSGEFNSFNIIFKVLRRMGYIDTLYNLKLNTYDKIKTLK